jgi:hypothetical protein
MDEILEVMKSVESRLARIELSHNSPHLKDLLVKSHYSTKEVARLSQQHGTKPAKPFTVRLACADGRVPGAEKFEDGQWRIPRDTVMQILAPERRN